MNTKSVLTGILISLTAGIVLFGWGCNASQTPTQPGGSFSAAGKSEKHLEGLNFPFQNPADVNELYCFGLQPWDNEGNNEIHGGTDLVVPYNPLITAIEKYPVVAPADGKIEAIIEGASGHDAITLVVIIKMNKYWYLICNFEPQTSNPGIVEMQRESLVVKVGQKVRRGELIGELVVANDTLVTGAYPHLHYGFFYKHPKDTLEYIMEHYLEMRFSDGTDLAPRTGKGSPWKPKNLGIPTTFYCPYEYSLPEVKTIFDALPKKAANGDYCDCVCAYGSQDGDCGTCPK